MFNWVLITVGFILVILIIRQLLAAAQIFQNLYSQLITADSSSLPAEPEMFPEAAPTSTEIPANNASHTFTGNDTP